MIRLRLVPAVALTWLVAALATLVPQLASPAALGGWMLALAALVLTARGRMRAVAVLTLVAAAATASHVALAQSSRTLDLPTDDGRAIEVTATVTGKAERWASGTIAFDAVATEWRAGHDTTPVRLDIVVTIVPDRLEAADALAPGAVVTAQGTARRADPGDRAVLIVSARQLKLDRPPSGVLAVAADLRRGLVAAVDGLPQPGAGLLPGLAVGDTSIVGDELDAAMKVTSLAHLTAVSGANCAIVVGLAFAAAAALGLSRGLRVTTGLAALGGFVVLVTPEPSVVRAAAMAAIAMLGVLLGRTGIGIGILSLAVLVLLIADPWLSTSLGFALSVAATASLLLFARPLATGLAQRMPRVLALAIAVPLAAQLACGPLLVLIAPYVPLYGVAANLLAAPAAPIATVVGLAACLATPLPWLQSGLAAIAWAPSAWIAATAETFAGLPGAVVPWLDGVGGLALLTLVGLAVGVLVGLPASSRSRRVTRAAAGTVLALTVGVAVGGVALSGVVGRWTLPATWTVLACEVGQGDAVLLRSAGRTALIDTGPDAAALDGCLSRAGVATIDLLVLTHFDADHVGGVGAVRGRIGTVLHGPTSSPGDEAVLTELTVAGARVIEGEGGLTGSLGNARWRVLWPRGVGFQPGNDTSVVLEIEGDGIPRSLFLGDLSAAPQRALAASGTLRPAYALVKVAHHGSADQDAALYRTAKPAVALVTVGDNSYGHPRAEILDLVTSLGARVGRTDEHGIVAVWQDADRVTLWRERDVGPAR